MALGQIIRQKREKLGFTLDEVSNRTGFSKPYLSTIETGKVKNPPSDELLLKLEQLLQFEPNQLIHIAHMEKLPVDVREKFEETQAKNAELRELIRQVTNAGSDIDQLRQTTKFQELIKDPGGNVQQVHTAGKLVPVINDVVAGYPVDFDDKGYPPGGADDYVRCPDLHDPNAFAVRVVGDSMETKYHQGDIIVFSPATEVRNGDDCFVRMADPHATTFKQVFFEDNDQIRLQPRNHKYSPTILPREKINGLWRVVIRYERLND